MSPPSTSAPIGRTGKPTPKGASDSISWANSLPLGTQALPIAAA